MSGQRTAKVGARRRLDQVILDRGLAVSRTRARNLVELGFVKCDGSIVAKPSMLVALDAEIIITGEDYPWVSRGGVKLSAALDHFRIDVTDAVCLDAGASTGGFSDVLLSRGAVRVFAVDVGHGQLARRLVEDARVIDLEGMDTRALTKDEITETVDLVVADVSFISLSKAIEVPLGFVRSGGRFVGLVKPQFEVGPNRVGKSGVVRDPSLQYQVCEEVQRWILALGSWSVVGVIDSPIEGRDGNREFLLVARKLW